MKLVVVVLLLALGLVQYRIWVDRNGLVEVWRLRQAVTAQRAENGRLRERNRRLLADVRNLKGGTEAVEERARRDLGMIGDGETFYQVVDR